VVEFDRCLRTEQIQNGTPLSTGGASAEKRHVETFLNKIKWLQLEIFGYHNPGDPWKERRYSSD
jgi:hypothetical protein